MINSQQGNDLIKEKIENNEIFAVSRIGGGVSLCCFFQDKFNQIPPQAEHMCRYNDGFYGDNIKEFTQEYIDGIKAADIQIEWKLEFLKEAQNYLFDKFSPDSVRSENRAVEPFYFDNPWSASLKGKKVLVVHPFKESIEYQYHNNREKIFENKDVLPEFDLKVVKAYQSLGNSQPHGSWFETFEILKSEIRDIDFDIALLGCGSYGLPLVSFIKNEMNRSAIYIGGGLQILFGIKGQRWDTHDVISKLYNENWIRPKETEKLNEYKNIEGGCYW